ncbi:MAG: translocation/assembly module TamB domain-containing protein, partial [Phycisphaerae bacterium]|nr:translocation/assembly module TamB domain-containing protein [Phycisphaerae bacterium]
GISLQRVSVMGPLAEAVTVHGHIPVTIVPAQWPRPWQALTGSPLRLEAVVGPDPAVTQELLEQTGIRMVHPDVRLTLSGSLAEPQGRIEAKASQIDLGPRLGRPGLPVLDEVALEAAVRRDCVTLSGLTMEVEGQAVEVTGECPVPAGYWAGLWGAPSLPDWRTASGRLRIDQARIEAFRQAGGVLLPLGTAGVDISLHPGGLWDGQLTLDGASTRPLGALPAIRDIQARVRVEGRSARIEEWTAHLGGQPVTMTGWARWTDANNPEFTFALEGQNVPLARQAGLVLRSDVDLQVVQARGRVAQVTGQVTLRDSLYLRDLRLLIPSGEGQSSHRPPYFSVTEGPLADWGVALQVRGDRFMQVRTPWFSGEVSADVHVQGSLREPIATGEAWVERGEVRFPFVDFQVDRGLVELTLANPYEPTLDLSATGQGYGHILKLSVTGPAAQPLLSFTSTPALTSEAILLLVTSGALPTGGATLTAAQRFSQVAGFFARDLWRRVSLDDEAADRLSIRSGEDLTVTGQPTRTIEYELSDRWSVYGEYDRFNQVNAGLKWKVYSR